MSFHRRYIDIEILENARLKGYDYIYRLINKPDCLSIHGELAQNICEILMSNHTKEDIIYELKKINFIIDESN
ncbi:MAG: hypothetical protein M0R46_10640 [Candidatus Muirbacterium halophilum]|nr:hypothetical protein [Candidatus Muirbacterium halophilum]